MITGPQARALPETLAGMGAGEMARRVIYCDEVGSTQDTLMRRADGEPDGAVLVAGRQLCGRGRMGRSWASPSGTLTFSVLLRPDMPPDMSGIVMLGAAVSLYDTIREYVPRARLEWPNDIMADGKLAGIVLDSSVADVLEWVVVGVGVNVANDPREVAEELTSDGSFGGSDSVHLHAAEASAYDILAGFLARLYSYHSSMGRDAHHVISAYQKRCWNVGRQIRRGDVLGMARGIDRDGALLVETEAGMRRVLF